MTPVIYKTVIETLLRSGFGNPSRRRQLIAIAITKMDAENLSKAVKELPQLVPHEDYKEILSIIMDIFSRCDITSDAALVECKLIQPPPAHLLVSAAKFILSKAAYQRYVEPHVEDIRYEYYEAWKVGEHLKARWIEIRGYWQALWPLAVAIWGTIAALVKMST